MRTPIRTIAIVCLLALPSVAQTGVQQFASLGDFKLESGETIRDCRIGYRTYGNLNSGKSNALLFPTWFSGTTEQLGSGAIGPGKLADSSKYYVVAVDALGNGVSSSPSNSQVQPRMEFPRFTVRDMVESQYKLLTQVLHLNHLKAVMGISMGGMQTFQWMVSYPEFFDKAIPIVGSPRLSAYDLLHWQTENDAIMNDPGWKHGDYTDNPARTPLKEIGSLIGTTPEKFNRETRREDVPQLLEKSKREPAFDANNHIRQGQAVMALDVSSGLGGSMERAAAAVKARTLVVIATYDHVVTPEPARDFARHLQAQVLELPSDCGHQMPACESQAVMQAVAGFLEK